MALRKGESHGSSRFAASIANAASGNRAVFTRLIEWAEWLKTVFPNVRLLTYAAPGAFTLRLRIMPQDKSLATVGNKNGQPYIALRRPVFAKYAPGSIDLVERAIGGAMGDGAEHEIIKCKFDELLWSLTAAYKEAN